MYSVIVNISEYSVECGHQKFVERVSFTLIFYAENCEVVLQTANFRAVNFYQQYICLKILQILLISSIYMQFLINFHLINFSSSCMKIYFSTDVNK